MNQSPLSATESVESQDEEETIRSKRRVWSQSGAVMSQAGRIALALAPSFLNPRNKEDEQSVSRMETAYLDGIRGIGAVLVFIQHFTTPFLPAIVGDKSRELHSWSMFQYPILRLFYSGGSFSVALFFVLSGFALSRKPMVLKKNFGTELGLIEKEIGSAIFRRGIRLFLPAISVVIIMMMGACFGAYEDMVPGLPADRFDLRAPKHLPSPIDQILDASNFVLSQLLYPSQWLHHVPVTAGGMYGFHLWTISVEFWASQLLFLGLIALIRCKRSTRAATMSLLVFYALWCFRWEIALFLMGAIICDFDHSKILQPLKPTVYTRAILGPMSWICFLLGLWVGSMPDFNGEVTPGFRFLWSTMPWEPFWHSLGAVLVIWSITRSRAIQSVFGLQVVQYFGKISFSVYLVHVPILSSFGWWSVQSLLAATNPHSQMAHQALIWMSGILYLAFVIWIADIFWRFIDRPSIQLARCLQRRFQSD
jgi:peptidoglycan/LPS O-acetylase OafA/YrhL